MKLSDEYVRNGVSGGELSLAGPSVRPAAAKLPVRGDLAHIRLAGVHFVPHYAVPMPHRVTGEAELRKADNPTAETLETLAADVVFNVLDMAGGWAWGQVGEDGFVGYLPMDVLEVRRS